MNKATRLPSRPRGATALAALALLAACSTPPAERFHSLVAPARDAASGLRAAAPSVSLLPVVLPAQLDRAQWVLRRDDDSYQVLEQERWLAPLADELQGAITLNLQAQAQAQALPAAPAGGDWRVALELRRWDARLGLGSRIDARWQVLSGTTVLRSCEASLEQAAAGGLEALALAHRAVVAQLADAIGRSLRHC